MSDPAQCLKALLPEKAFFVGVDSDGCVFDTMGIKHLECLCPLMISCFGLQPVARGARQCKAFADLHSRSRGANRHRALVRILRDLLPTHPQVTEQGFAVPQLPHYFAWVDDPRSVLSHEGLEQAIGAAETTEARNEFAQVLAWNLSVNEMIAEKVKHIPPFAHARESLQKVATHADMIVCSTAPCTALEQEWGEHGLADYTRVLGGQDMGHKAEQLAAATHGKYQDRHCLMIGDAPGDLQAARTAGVLFYPIIPGQEAESWKRFLDEAFDRFLNLDYAGDYEAELISAFYACLPENPTW
jgi:phosphoglycolate phosphatase-like HAD superfamily hydrolase